MAHPLLPIIYQEYLQLTDIGVNLESICFNKLTMESDKFICVRDTYENQSHIVIIDMNDIANPKRRPIQADSAVMHPFQKILALKGETSLKIYNLDTKSRIKSHTMNESVLFMRWISLNTLAVITANSVFHWSMEGDSTPVKAFDNDSTLHDCKIINYQTDAAQKWLLLTGQSLEPNRNVCAMQLYSVEWQCSQPFEAYASAFATFKIDCNIDPSIILCFATQTAQSIRLYVTEVGPPPSTNVAFSKRSVDVYFPPEAQFDYPVAIQVSAKYNAAYLVTNYGYIHIYDIESAQCMCMHRISADTIFVTAPHEVNGGIIGVNRSGQVLSVTIDENNIIPYIANILQNPDLAARLAIRNNLGGFGKTKSKKKKQKNVGSKHSCYFVSNQET